MIWHLSRWQLVLVRRVFYSNGQLIGLTCPNAYGMGSITYAPFEASPVERTMEHQDGTASHFDGQGHMTEPVIKIN